MELVNYWQHKLINLKHNVQISFLTPLIHIYKSYLYSLIKSACIFKSITCIQNNNSYSRIYFVEVAPRTMGPIPQCALYTCPVLVGSVMSRSVNGSRRLAYATTTIIALLLFCGSASLGGVHSAYRTNCIQCKLRCMQKCTWRCTQPTNLFARITCFSTSWTAYSVHVNAGE